MNVKWYHDADDGELYPIPEYNDNGINYDIDNHDISSEEIYVKPISLKKTETTLQKQPKNINKVLIGVIIVFAIVCIILSVKMIKPDQQSETEVDQLVEVQEVDLQDKIIGAIGCLVPLTLAIRLTKSLVEHVRNV